MKSKYQQKFARSASRKDTKNITTSSQPFHTLSNIHSLSPASVLRQEYFLLKRQCFNLSSELSYNQQQYDRESEQLATLRTENGVLVMRKKMLIKRLGEMQNNFAAIEDEHRKKLQEILAKINRYSKVKGIRSEEKKEESKLEQLYGELENFKEKIFRQEEKEKAKFGVGIEALEKLQQQNQQLEREIQLICGTKKNFSELSTSESSSLPLQAKACLRALLS